MLKQCDIFVETPLKYLIDSMPGRNDNRSVLLAVHNLCVHKCSISLFVGYIEMTCISTHTDVAEMCLSRFVETNEGDQTSFMDKIRPGSEAFQVTYDYEFLQEVNPDSLR